MLFSKKRFMASTMAALVSTMVCTMDQSPKDHREGHQDLQNRWFDFGGDAFINANGYIRLTQDEPSQSGHLWSRLPLGTLRYEIEFEFRVHGKGTGLFGDGFAVWLTKERGEAGPVFGNRDRFTGLGIFFDTYANSRQPHSFPYVMAMLGDGQTSYDNDHDGLANKLGGCESDFRGKDVPTIGRLSYDSVAKTLTLAIQTKAVDQWDDCFRLYDITLPPSTYLGFTAHTGEVHDSHDIIGVSSYLADAESGKPEKYNNTPPPLNKSGFSWIFKLITASGIFAGIVVVVYKSTKKNDMKRF
ncbi:hypothetical protein BGZ49_009681 [Haplosporangium sp. Z 27]|nr:hypothetical protein BGZ49_009681 [Haplosporangium sp. Z 27]